MGGCPGKRGSSSKSSSNSVSNGSSNSVSNGSSSSSNSILVAVVVVIAVAKAFLVVPLNRYHVAVHESNKKVENLR